ncbi:aKG-HExxH-type peptide beta-hydroxylase [Streptomyces sp. NPDC093225]|uniref:aKG-HExxH-type peptide beta-hydroxylase n=1 Tax=Streptomyces sp. NPDC093225 TaxID=3366034 RepID=UPI0038020657
MTGGPEVPGFLRAEGPVLRALASTEPSPEGARLLRDARRSKRLLLLRAVLDAAPNGEGGEHWALLEEAERHDPTAVQDVLHYPSTGVWAEETLRLLHPAADGPHDGPHGAVHDGPHGGRPDDTPAPDGPAPGSGPPRRRPAPAPDLGHLGALAVAAALRAGLTFKAVLRPTQGRLALPTLGLFRPARPGPVALTEASWDPADPAVLPLHALPGGRTVLDDLDPYRAPATGMPVQAARRLTPRGHRRWDTQWSAALTLLDRYDPARAAEAAGLLRSVVPLAGGSRSTGATLPAAPGSVLVRSQSPPALAATLVHEVQHGKLAALTDLVTLHTADRTPRHWAPWRSDPRPFEGLLHGTYAHLALARYWQRAALFGARAAWATHARYRAQVAAVLPGLQDHPHLTPAGREFTRAMAEAEAAMDELPPPGDPYATARAALARERRAWLDRHPELAAVTPG